MREARAWDLQIAVRGKVDWMRAQDDGREHKVQMNAMQPLLTLTIDIDTHLKLKHDREAPVYHKSDRCRGVKF